MTGVIARFEHDVLILVWIGLAMAGAMVAAVVLQRMALAMYEARVRRFAKRYGPLVTRAMDGDAAAMSALVRSPRRHRVGIARLVAGPLILDRDAASIAAARAIFAALQMKPEIERYLHSHSWRRRVLGLRGLGLTQDASGAPDIVSALDDRHPAVRNAAVDALADLQSPETLPAIVVRVHDASLERGRVLAALEAFGPASEAFLLQMAEIDGEHRLNYAEVLAYCGTERARALLCKWTSDPSPEIRTAAFRALARVGLDAEAAGRALAALETAEIDVRAMAAQSLNGWTGGGDAAACLARHLDDSWTVAVHAARSLRSIDPAGRAALESYATRQGLGGDLARQMLWEEKAGW
jgi:HEAT repeat protein